MPEELRRLEGAAEAEAGKAVRRQPDELDLIERHAPGIGPVEAGEQIERRCLPGAVRPDDAGDASGFSAKAQVLHGAHAAEAHGEILDLQPAAGPAALELALEANDDRCTLGGAPAGLMRRAQTAGKRLDCSDDAERRETQH